MILLLMLVALTSEEVEKLTMQQRVGVVASWPVEAQVLEFKDLSEQELHEYSFCYSQGADSGASYRFCISDRRWERARVDLDKLLKRVPAQIAAQDRKLAEYTKTAGDVTFVADARKSFWASQKAWEVSFSADCTLQAIAVRTAPVSTAAVTALQGCEADRMLARIEFLKNVYEIE